MGTICRYCGASSLTSDKCSNCGAPIDVISYPVAPKLDKIQNATHRHFIAFVQNNVNRRILIRIVTNIYVDDMLSFSIISASNNVGRCKVRDNALILEGLNKCSNGSKLSNASLQYVFGKDEESMVNTLSDIIVNGVGVNDENRVRFETKLEKRVLPSLVAIFFGAIFFVAFILGVYEVVHGGNIMSKQLGIFFTIWGIIFTICIYQYLRPKQL